MNKIRIAGAAAGVVLVSGMVLQVSSAAFTDTTDNTGNSWAAGTVSLTDNDGGSALYASKSNLIPGYTETKCIQVTYDGTVDPSAAIALVGVTTSTAGGADGDGLADDLDLVLDIGPAGSSCATMVDPVLGVPLNLPGTTNLHTGTLQSFNDAGVTASGWTPNPTNVVVASRDLMRPFRFKITMPNDNTTPNNAQGDSATANFTWSATS